MWLSDAIWRHRSGNSWPRYAWVNVDLLPEGYLAKILMISMMILKIMSLKLLHLSGAKESTIRSKPLQWRHNGRDSVSNHQPHDCFPNRLFRHRSKKTPKLRVTGCCAGNSPGTGEFPHKWPVTRKCFHLMTSSWVRDTRGVQHRKHQTSHYSTIISMMMKGLPQKFITMQYVWGPVCQKQVSRAGIHNRIPQI